MMNLGCLIFHPLGSINLIQKKKKKKRKKHPFWNFLLDVCIMIYFLFKDQYVRAVSTISPPSVKVLIKYGNFSAFHVFFPQH